MSRDDEPMKSRLARMLAFRRATVWLLVVAGMATLGGCIESRTAFLVVDNKTASPFLARFSGYSHANETSGPYSTVVDIPPMSQVGLGKIGFASPITVEQVEILDPDCAVVGRVSGFDKGTLITIADGPTVELREEFPPRGNAAVESQSCPAEPSPSP